jgi:hypothetical protein
MELLFSVFNILWGLFIALTGLKVIHPMDKDKEEAIIKKYKLLFVYWRNRDVSMGNCWILYLKQQALIRAVSITALPYCSHTSKVSKTAELSCWEDIEIE